MNNFSKGSPEFESWWEETYKGKLSNVPIIELAFKEIALTTWNQAIKDLEDCRSITEDLRLELRQRNKYIDDKFKFTWEQ